MNARSGEERSQEMVVAVTVDIPGGAEQQYEQIFDTIFPEGTHPEGLLVHVTGPFESGWRVLNVAASQEQFEAFAREHLLPAARLAGNATPELAVFPVHRLIWNRANYSGPCCRPSDGEAQPGQAGRVSTPLWKELPCPDNSTPMSS
jgi:hypothetical protein